MIFKYFLLRLRIIFIIRSLFLGVSLEIVYCLWYRIRIYILIRIYNHLTYILLILEVITIISLILLLLIFLKIGINNRFLFLFLCLVVGEAVLGLSLLIINTRFQSIELISLNLI